MPNAQGRITIRRRPKNGEDGSDAVNFRFIPSASSIVLQKDGTLRPSALSARLVKNEGGLDADMISQAFDGYTVLCQIKKSNGNSNSGYTPGTSLDLTSHAQTLLSVDFELLRDSKVVASTSVPCIPAGIDGEDAYVLDLDNEMEAIPCNSSGTPTGTGTLASTNSTVYKGSKVDTGWTFSRTDTGCTSSINASTGAVSVTAISADKASVAVTATKGSLARTATFSLYKVKAGANGSSPVVYSIETSASAISKDADGSLSPASVTAYKNKTVGTSKSRTTDMTLKYQRIGQDTSEKTLTGEGGTIDSISGSCTAIEIKLLNGTQLLDSERIPVVKDGSDGKDGSDAVTILVSPENVEFNYSTSVASQIIRVDVYKSGKKLVYNDDYTCSTLTNGSSTQITTGLLWGFSTDDDGFYYRLTYAAGNDINMTVPFTVTVEGSAYSKAIYIHTVKNGSPGAAGPQGIQGCIYRQTLWTANTEYRNDSELVTSGVRYIDIALVKDSSRQVGYQAFMCRLTHVSDDSNNPVKEFNDLGSNAGIDTQHWRKMNALSPIYTPFIFAEGGVINLMQSNQILITEDVMSPGSLTVSKFKTLGANKSLTSDMTLTYQRIGQDANPITITGESGSVDDISSQCTSIEFRLLNGSTVLDSERVRILNTWEEGTSFTLDLDNETQAIPCNSSGTPSGGGTLASTNATVYNGSKIDTGWTFSKVDVNCTSSINPSSGTISVTAVSADNASVNVTATKGSLTRTATFSLYKVKASSANATPPVYSIETSANVIVRSSEGKTTAGFSGSNGGERIRIWAGSQIPDDAPFRVDANGKVTATDAEIEGRVVAGSSDGQRVELQPDNKSMKIYDESGMEAASYEGNTYTSLASLFSSESGSFAMNGYKKGLLSLYGNNSGASDYSLAEYHASSAIHSDTPIEVVVSGYLQTYCTDPALMSASPPEGGPSTQSPTNQYASASLAVYVYTYSDAALTIKTGSALVASCGGRGNRTLSNARAKTSSGGYHVVVVRVHLVAHGSDQYAVANWGSSVSQKADISVTYTSDFYVSRYFANGFCLGRSTSNYILAYSQGSAGMRFIMENSGYGFDVSGSGIKYRHHSGSWINMPMLVFRGRATHSTSGSTVTYSWASSSSYNSANPTLARVSEGNIKATFPSSWTSAGITPSNCIINVVGYGVNKGGSFPVKAQIFEIGSDYVTVTVSDDESPNDGSFFITIYTV